MGLLIFVPSKLLSQDYDAIIKSKKDQRSDEMNKRIIADNEKQKQKQKEQQNELKENELKFFSFGSSKMDDVYPGLSSKIKNITASMYKKCPEKTILFQGTDRIEFSTIREIGENIDYKSVDIRFSISERYKILNLQERLDDSEVREVASFNIYAILPVTDSNFQRNGYSIRPGWSQYGNEENTKKFFGNEKWKRLELFRITAIKFRDGRIVYRPVVTTGLISKFSLFNNIYEGTLDYYFNSNVEIKSDIINCNLSKDKIEKIGYDYTNYGEIYIPELNFVNSVHASLYPNTSPYPDMMTFIENETNQFDAVWSYYRNNVVDYANTNFNWVGWNSIPEWLDGNDIEAGQSASVAKPASPPLPGEARRIYSGRTPGLVFKGPEARGYLGVSIQDVDSVSSRELGITPGRGVIVRGIVPKQAADIAGIRPDDVILKIEKWAVTPEQTVQSILESYEAGQEISVQLIRNGVNLQVMVKLGQRPSN